MTSGIGKYMRAAFSARPAGMFVPPNWVMMAAIAIAGTVIPGLWLIGLGVELAYLYLLTFNKRFQRFVDGAAMMEQATAWEQRVNALLAQVSHERHARYLELDRRCRVILEEQSKRGLDAGMAVQSQGFGRFTWIYLQLLVAQESLVNLLRKAAGDGEPLEKRAARLEQSLEDQSLTPELRESLNGQLEIVRQRIQKQREAKEKLLFTEAELQRIENQVELIREQAALSEDANGLSSRINEVTASLTTTSKWISDQQRILGWADSVAEGPPSLVGTKVAE